MSHFSDQMITQITDATFLIMCSDNHAPEFFAAIEATQHNLKSPADFADVLKAYAHKHLDTKRGDFNFQMASAALQIVDWPQMANTYWHDYRLGRLRTIFAPYWAK